MFGPVPSRLVRRQDKADRIGEVLDDLYPEPPIPLDHADPYTLLVAVALSAQTTDKKVNQVTPGLFAVADTPEKMASLDPDQILEIIREVGLAPTKAKNLWLAANQIVDAGGEVIADWDFLESLAGVGHKTASVVMSQAFGVPAFPVDTHIHRLAARWGLSDGSNVERTERDLKAVFPTRHVERAPPADHLLRPRVLPGAAPRSDGVPDLLVRGDEEAHRAGSRTPPPLSVEEPGQRGPWPSSTFTIVPVTNSEAGAHR